LKAGRFIGVVSALFGDNTDIQQENDTPYLDSNCQYISTFDSVLALC
jgi:hypothetical protein